MNYGMPYKGSKSAIADKIIDVLPAADYFVDLFGGGGAVSHFAALSGKYKTVIYNELDSVVYKGFKMAISGEFADENRWISRDDFKKLKDTDPYAAICFSFGNDLKTYAYSPEVERFKKHLHKIFFSETPRETRLHWKSFVGEFVKAKKEIEQLTQSAIELCAECGVEPLYCKDGMLDADVIKTKVFKVNSADIRNYFRRCLAESGKTQADVDRHLGNQMSGHYFGESQWALPTPEQYEKMLEILPLDIPWSDLNKQLNTIKTLDNLQSLQSLERLPVKCYNLSYEQVVIPENSVIYCDIPYKGTSKYRTEFDYERFYKWALNQTVPVYISEYQMPDGFEEIFSVGKTSSFGTGNGKRTTKTFLQ